MMLHHRLFGAYVVAGLAVAGVRAAEAEPAGDAGAGPPPAAPIDPRRVDLVTQADREALRRRLDAVVVEVHRELPPPPGMHVPGGLHVRGAGWIVAPGRVVTVETLVEGWPRADGDRIRVRGADGAWRRAAVGLSDRSLGLAVLDVPGLSGAAAAAPPSGRLGPGRHLYVVGAPGATLQPAVVVERGEGALAYYWVARGAPLPPGAPVAGTDGTIVTVAGMRVPGDEPTRSLLLPEESLRDLFARSAEWLP